MPVECGTLRETSTAVERRLDCVRYRECVDVAAKREWLSFSCRYCRVRETTAKAIPPMRCGDVEGQ